MDKDDLIEFLKENLRIKISREMQRQWNDYEYTEKLQVSLVLMDEYREIEIDSDYISLDDLKR